MNKILVVIGGFLLVITSLFVLESPKKVPDLKKVPPPNLVAPQFPNKPAITNVMPGYQNYSDIQKQLASWKQQAPGLVETGVYGKTKLGSELSYIRVTNLFDSSPKKKVMVTACIHGNEPHAASTTMAFIGDMLSKYTADSEITELINTRDIYFVPVVSPDSYPNSRMVDGVDPNRDFPHPIRPKYKSTPSIAAIQDFFNKHKFNAVISGHTFGRVYLTPYGDTTRLCPDNDEYTRIVGKMQSLSQYRRQRACETYGRPIFGTEVDWYYRNGAFAIVTEYGTHQRIPSMSETKIEFDKTYKATLLFIKEAPLVQLKSLVFGGRYDIVNLKEDQNGYIDQGVRGNYSSTSQEWFQQIHFGRITEIRGWLHRSDSYSGTITGKRMSLFAR